MNENSRHQDWYSIWTALSFTRSFIAATRGKDPDSHEIDRLLQVCQYMSRLNTIVVDSNGTADMSLVDPEQTVNPEKVAFLLENWELVEEQVELPDENGPVTEVEIQ